MKIKEIKDEMIAFSKNKYFISYILLIASLVPLILFSITDKIIYGHLSYILLIASLGIALFLYLYNKKKSVPALAETIKELDKNCNVNTCTV